MEKENNKNIEIDLKGLVLFLSKKLWVSVIAAVIVFATVYWYSSTKITPLYTSKSQILVMSNNAAYSSQSVLMDDNFTKNYVHIIKSNKNILQNVIDQNGFEMTAAQLSSKMSVSSPDETQIIEISITDPDPAMAKNLSSYICIEARKFITEEITKTDNIRVIDPDTNPPSNPSSPNVTNNSVSSAVVAFLVVNVLMASLYYINGTLVTVEDVEKSLNIKVIASIPHSQTYAGKKNIFSDMKRKNNQ